MSLEVSALCADLHSGVSGSSGPASSTCARHVLKHVACIHGTSSGVVAVWPTVSHGCSKCALRSCDSVKNMLHNIWMHLVDNSRQQYVIELSEYPKGHLMDWLYIFDFSPGMCPQTLHPSSHIWEMSGCCLYHI